MTAMMRMIQMIDLEDTVLNELCRLSPNISARILDKHRKELCSVCDNENCDKCSFNVGDKTTWFNLRGLKGV
jgi:hypothetical protein